MNVAVDSMSVVMVPRFKLYLPVEIIHDIISGVFTDLGYVRPMDEQKISV